MRFVNTAFLLLTLVVGGWIGILTHSYVVDNELERLKNNIKTLEASYLEANMGLRLELKAAQGDLIIEKKYGVINREDLDKLLKESFHLKGCLGKAQIDVVTCHKRNANLGILYDKALEEIDARNDWAHGLEEIIFKTEEELGWAREQVRQDVEVIEAFVETVRKAIVDLTAHLRDQPCVRIEAILNDLTYTLYTETQ